MSNHTHRCTDVHITRDEKTSEVEIRAEIPADIAFSYRSEAIKRLGAQVEMDGFRKGSVPEDILVKHVGEQTLLQTIADMALTEELPKLLAAEEILAITAPQVAITKLADGNPIGFTARVAVYPEVTLPDYKKIAKGALNKKESVEVTDEEIEETMTFLRRERAKIEKIESGLDATKAHEEAQSMDTLSLPGIDDQFVHTLGYENLEDFKKKLRENILQEKEQRAREAIRIAILESLMEKTSCPTPSILIEHELDKLESQMNSDLVQAKSSLEQYLKQTGKTRDALRDEWRDPAQKRAKTRIILGEIARAEKITADEEALVAHIEQVKKQHPEAAEVHVRAYFEELLRNEAVLRFLEEQQ